MTAITPTLATPAPTAPVFVGREAEGRAVIVSVRAGRSVQLEAPSGYGKSALLAELAPGLQTLAVTLRVPRAAPFGTFLADLAGELLTAGLLPGWADLAAWKKAHPNNDAKGRALVAALQTYRATGATPPIILIDDATGLSASMVPHLLALMDYAAVVYPVQPEGARKAALSRLWQRCDRVELPPLDRAEARALVDHMTARYNIVAQDMHAYKNRVLSLAEGVPGEIERLVRYVSTHDLVRNADIGSGFAQQAAQRQERGYALAPILLVIGAVAMVTKYVGLARGEMDMYVAGGVGIAFFMVASPFLRKLMVTR